MIGADSSTATMPDIAGTSATWVIGVDGSECAWHATRWGIEHAPGRADRILVTSAWSAPPIAPFASTGLTTAAWEVDEMRAAARAEANDVAQRMVRALGGRDRADAAANGDSTDAIPVETVVVEGASSSVVLDASTGASLVVLGSRGRGGFSRLVLGSTSTQCATHAVRPTVIVPLDAPISEAHRILVAFDGSENSAAALRWAVGFADQDAIIDCAMVWDVAPIVVGSDQFFFPEASDLARARFDHLVAEVLDGCAVGGGSRPRVVQRFVEGRPRAELARCAERADLLVMGARGHGAIGAALLGSVSTWLLHHVDRAMVVVPGDPSATLGE